MENGRSVRPTVVGVAVVAVILCVLVWRFEIVRVAGGSMKPALSHGDITVVARQAEANPGDIVLMEQPGRSAVLHRVLRRTEGGWLTKGDANPVPDWTIAPDSWLRGRVVAVIPAGRALERWR